MGLYGGNFSEVFKNHTCFCFKACMVLQKSMHTLTEKDSLRYFEVHFTSEYTLKKVSRMLNSYKAIRITIAIVRAFVALHWYLFENRKQNKLCPQFFLIK